VSDLPARVRAALAAVAEPARAAGMQAYMKTAMPYLGVPAAPMRAACKTVFAELSFASAAEWEAEVRAIWDGAVHREELYAALELTAVRQARGYQTIAALPLYEHLAVTGAWWDVVDPVASGRLWGLFRHDPAPMRAAMLAWAADDDIWKRRCAILCQNPAKRETDPDLLAACIAPSHDRPEFWLRKAIGWALRQYARVDPDWVRAYVAANRMSGLSRREALKRIGEE
jgi:3-methyladenine DNA glycosylase AlkD